MINANYHGSGPSQFAPGSRMNKMMWDSLTPKAQRIWDDNKQANSLVVSLVIEKGIFSLSTRHCMDSDLQG